MTMMPKSGWPVTGQIEVNSGKVKRATYFVSLCGLGTRSSTASSGEAGIATGRPSWSVEEAEDFVVDLAMGSKVS